MLKSQRIQCSYALELNPLPIFFAQRRKQQNKTTKQRTSNTFKTPLPITTYDCVAFTKKKIVHDVEL